jgi:REP element-mobilizing transposase RayT
MDKKYHFVLRCLRRQDPFRREAINRSWRYFYSSWNLAKSLGTLFTLVAET